LIRKVSVAEFLSKISPYIPFKIKNIEIARFSYWRWSPDFLLIAASTIPRIANRKWFPHLLLTLEAMTIVELICLAIFSANLFGMMVPFSQG
jgi:hypothetical protein